MGTAGLKQKARLDNVVRVDLMAKIHDDRVRGLAQKDALHLPDIRVETAEIGEQNDNRSHGGFLRPDRKAVQSPQEKAVDSVKRACVHPALFGA